MGRFFQAATTDTSCNAPISAPIIHKVTFTKKHPKDEAIVRVTPTKSLKDAIEEARTTLYDRHPTSTDFYAVGAWVNGMSNTTHGYYLPFDKAIALG